MDTAGASANDSYLAPTHAGGLRWGTLEQGVLVRRYKRFLADVQLPDRVVTAHTPNTGAMIGCCQPGQPVWLSRHNGKARKHEYTLEMIAMPTALVGINTGVPNRLVRQAILDGVVAELPRPHEVRSEVKRGDSRLDLLLANPGEPDTLVEIKNCTLAENGAAKFPDAVTARGAKHLEELARLRRNGDRAVIFILVQRGDAEYFTPADEIDPHWGTTLRQVLRDGVELLAYQAEISIEEIRLGRRLPVRL
ncbi:MAG: DNA/RNA nuclease SfsA [Planctomycetes bacterium]|nr:DNA/RNA nuclease SfsA [Planctomycetota bacterium]